MTTISKLNPPNLFPPKIVPPLHNCLVKAVTSALPPVVVDDDTGLEPRLFHLLAGKLGFKVGYENLPDGEYVWSLFDDDNEPMNALKLLWENQVDVTFSAMAPDYTSDFVDFLPQHFQEELVWFVPGPKLASKAKSIFKAFTLQMWVLVISAWICVLMTLILAALLKGTPVLPLFLNTLAIHLNLATKFVKSQRFFGLIAFVYLYSLHITTAYQSSLIIFLSDIPREKPIDSLEDFAEADLDIMVHIQFEPLADELAKTSAYREILRPEKLTFHDYLHLERIVETGACALLGPLISFGFSLIADKNYYYDEKRFPKVLILKNSIRSFHASFLLSKGHPLSPILSKYILDLLAAGLPEHFLKEQLRPAPRPLRQIEPFGMDEIEGPFYLYLGLISVSCLAWIAELIVFYCHRKELKFVRKKKKLYTNVYVKQGALLNARSFIRP